MQPYAFPYIGYFQLINATDQFVIYDDVNYIKSGWINRNMILINGKKNYINISLTGASQNKLINELDVSDDFIKFLKTIKMAYAKAPHFEEVYELLSSICKFDDKNLSKFLGNSILEIFNYLKIDKSIEYSSNLSKNNALRGQSKVIDICKTLDADRYINAIGGQELYEKNDFISSGIELNFLKTHFKEYKQFKNEFIPGLSIIDVLMFNTVQDITEFLAGYELI